MGDGGGSCCLREKKEQEEEKTGPTSNIPYPTHDLKTRLTDSLPAQKDPRPHRFKLLSIVRELLPTY